MADIPPELAPDDYEATPVAEAPAPRGASRWLTRGVPLALAGLALAVGAIMLAQSAPAAAPTIATSDSIYSFQVGSPAPEFKLETLEGQTVSLQDFRGKNVVLNFWATWCPPCRSEMPDMQQLSEERSDVVVLAVNLQEARDPVSSFITKYGLRFPVLFDRTGEVSQAFKVSSLPTSFFIDKNGNIASFNVGALNRSAMAKRLDDASARN